MPPLFNNNTPELALYDTRSPCLIVNFHNAIEPFALLDTF